jgi:hypothetical protein
MPLSFGVAKNFRSSEFRDPAVQFGDFFVFNYTNTDGSDLDIRFQIISPSVSGYLGWAANDVLSANGQNVAFYGGDSTTTPGTESVYVDKSKLLLAFPGITSFTVDLRAFWYGSVGSNPVVLNMDAYQGGVMVLTGTNYENPTATNNFPSSKSIPTILTLSSQNEATAGQSLALANIDFESDLLTYSGISTQ